MQKFDKSWCLFNLKERNARKAEKNFGRLITWDFGFSKTTLDVAVFSDVKLCSLLETDIYNELLPTYSGYFSSWLQGCHIPGDKILRNHSLYFESSESMFYTCVFMYVLHVFLSPRGVLVSMYVQMHEIMKHIKVNMQLHDSYAKVLHHVTVPGCW
jgi:hypothetical protein